MGDIARRASEAASSAMAEAESQRDAAMSEVIDSKTSATPMSLTNKTSATPMSLTNDQPETNEFDTGDDLVAAVEEGEITAEMKTDGPPIAPVAEAELFDSTPLV